MEYEDEERLGLVLGELQVKSRTNHPGKYSRFVATYKQFTGTQ